MKHTKFTFTESDLNTILDIPPVTPVPLSQTEAYNRCLTESTHPYNQTNPAYLSYLVFKKDPPLLYYVIVQIIMPKPISTGSVNTKTLELIYLLMTGKPLGTIAKVSSIQCSTPLPYPNLLAVVFKHFGVCLTNEIQEAKPVSVITPASLKNI